MEHKLSIIVPVYNEEKWIGRCLDSIIRQTFQNFAVIIINDGSTDSSMSIIEHYCQEDKRIRCITTENQGNAQALNVGLKYADGDLITFADADDYIENSMYETMVSVLDKSNADIVECGCRKINPVGRIIVQLEQQRQEIVGRQSCIRHFMKQRGIGNYVWNKVYKRYLFENLWFQDIRFSMDYHMNALLHSKIEKKVIISDVFYNYMIHSGQATNNSCIGKERIDGMKAGNMLARHFSYNKELKTYAGLYSCIYALDISEFVYKTNSVDIKDFLTAVKHELLHAITNVSLRSLESRDERKKIYQSILLLMLGEHYFSFKWLFDMYE